MTWFGPRTVLGECPRWDDDTARLSWVDIDGGTLHVATQTETDWETTTHPVAAPLAGAVLADAVAPRTGDRWLVAVARDVGAWTEAARVSTATTLEPPAPQCPVRLNEVVTDPLGRLWVGSMAYDWTVGAGSLFRIDLDGTVHRMLAGITIANGVGWSPDAATMYTTDTGPGEITAWDYDLESGVMSRPRRFASAGPGEGSPDGLAVDVDGNVWSAFAGGFAVRCFAPSGREIERVAVPAPSPTSCCFAGAERNRLVVTTARKRQPADLLAAHPDSGRMWDAGPMGVRGLPQPRTRVSLPLIAEVADHGR